MTFIHQDVVLNQILTAAILSASVTPRPILVEGWIYAKGATNSQDTFGLVIWGGLGGVGGNGTTGDLHIAETAGLAIDSTVNQTFKLTVQHSVAAATITWSRRNCQLQLQAVAA